MKVLSITVTTKMSHGTQYKKKKVLTSMTKYVFGWEYICSFPVQLKVCSHQLKKDWASPQGFCTSFLVTTHKPIPGTKMQKRDYSTIK